MATPDPGNRLEAARKERGLSLARAWAPVEAALGVLGCSSEQIRKYEKGTIPEDEWNPLVIQVLARAYGTTTEALSPIAAERTEKVLVLLGGRVTPGEDESGTADLPESESGWSGTTARQAA